MKKTFVLAVAVSCVMAFFGAALAADLQIKDYIFIWKAYKAPYLAMDVEKTPDGLSVALDGLGGPMAKLTMTPEEAKAIGEVLKTTQKYYDQQISKQDLDAKDTVEVGGFKVSFSSSRGKNFGVSVTTSKMLSAAVNMSREDALAVAPHLCLAPEMAALVQKRIKP